MASSLTSFMSQKIKKFDLKLVYVYYFILMEEVQNLILKDDPNLFKNKEMSFKSSMLRFAIENHCFEIANYMQTKFFVPPPIKFDKNRVLDCDDGKEWVYKNEVFELHDIFNYDLDPNLLDEWLKDKFIKSHQSMSFLLEKVTYVPNRHCEYFLQNLKRQVMVPTFLENCSEKLLLKFIKKKFTIENPEFICNDYDKIWSEYMSQWLKLDKDLKKQRFIQIGEKCHPDIIDMFLDVIELDFDILYCLLLRTNKDNSIELLDCIEQYVKKAKKELDYQEFGSWYVRRRKHPINNHDIYILIKNGYTINKKIQHIATTLFLIKECEKDGLCINEKSLLEFVENSNDQTDILKGIKIAVNSGLKLSGILHKILEEKNMNILDHINEIIDNKPDKKILKKSKDDKTKSDKKKKSKNDDDTKSNDEPDKKTKSN
jgi:hypothetical protein